MTTHQCTSNLYFGMEQFRQKTITINNTAEKIITLILRTHQARFVNSIMNFVWKKAGAGLRGAKSLSIGQRCGTRRTCAIYSIRLGCQTRATRERLYQSTDQKAVTITPAFFRLSPVNVSVPDDFFA